METTEQQGKFLGYAILVLAACFLLGSWYATQAAAKACGYHPLLGWGMELWGSHVYFPLAFFFWEHDPAIAAAIPDILRANKFPVIGGVLAGAGICFLMKKSFTQLTSHGTARFARREDIHMAGLDARKNGVVVGRNPFTNEIMLHDGPEHVFLAAPTRSGKGVGIIIPTAVTWHHSAFFFDPKQELWIHTSGYRKRVLRQKVIKFEPLCSDGSGARWNPYAEIDFQGLKEIDDTRTVNQTIVKTDENANKDPFWDDSAIGLLNGVTMHLLYLHHREGKPLPCPSDTISFLASPTMDKPHLFTSMKVYPHIAPEEFMEEEYEDADGRRRHRRNPLKEIYGEYIPDLKPFKAAIREAVRLAGREDALEGWDFDGIRTLDALREAIQRAMELGAVIGWEAPDIMKCSDKKEIDTLLNAAAGNPFYQLLVHPKVAEEAAKILGGADQTTASIISSAQTPLNLYQDPLIKRNTCVSDFCFRDLLDPGQAVSLYLVIQPNDVPKLRPLTRLFVNTMLAKTVRDMKFDVPAAEKQRLLMMLDEFPQLKKLDSIENTLAICAGYGVKICTVVQSITQLNQIYTKDNSILDNSQVQIYMTPSNLAAAKELSEIMGDLTIRSVSRSDNGKILGGSNSISEQGRKLMNPDELLRMSKEKELVIAQGCRPILCKKIKWFQEPFFKERVLAIPAPPFSDTRTEVRTYAQLFAVNAADVADMESRQEAVAKAREEAAQKRAAKRAQAAKAAPEKAEEAPEEAKPPEGAAPLPEDAAPIPGEEAKETPKEETQDEREAADAPSKAAGEGGDASPAQPDEEAGGDAAAAEKRTPAPLEGARTEVAQPLRDAPLSAWEREHAGELMDEEDEEMTDEEAEIMRKCKARREGA